MLKGVSFEGKDGWYSSDTFSKRIQFLNLLLFFSSMTVLVYILVWFAF